MIVSIPSQEIVKKNKKDIDIQKIED